MKAKIDFTKRNQKVAAKRGASWSKNLKLGKLDARLNPSKIQIMRIKKNINQTQVAKKFGMSLSTYGAIERGKRIVSPGIASKLAGFFGASQQELFKTSGKGKLLAIF